MKILLIDHDDSFIYNVIAWIKDNKITVEIKNYYEINWQNELDKYDGYILSPGPKSPIDYPDSLSLLKKTKKPIFGICLGFQQMLFQKDLLVQPYSPPIHGKSSELIFKNESDNFVKKPTRVARYHSLALKTNDPSIIATTLDGYAMIYKEKNLLGFQFHPESFLTENAKEFKDYALNFFLSKGELNA